MRSRALVVAVFAATCVEASAAHAANVRGRFSALFSGSEDVQAGEDVGNYPIYGLGAVEVDDLGIPGMDESRLVVQGWGRLQAGDDDLRDTTGDVQLLFLQTRNNWLTLRLGRQMLVAGAANMDTIDGVMARAQLPLGFSVQGFWGLKVYPELHYSGNAWEAGGRVAYNLVAFNYPGEIGVSYVQERTLDGSQFRNTLGVDGFTLVGPTRWVGYVAVDPADPNRGLVEAELAGSWDYHNQLELTVDYKRTIPVRFLPANSIFTVFTNISNDQYGGSVGWLPSPYWELRVSGHAIVLDQDAYGFLTGVRLVAYRDPLHHSLIGGSIDVLRDDSDGYTRARLFTALEIIPSIHVTGDVYYYALEQPPNFRLFGNDGDYAALGRLSVIWDIMPWLRLVGSAGGGSTPEAEGYWDGQVRIAYGYDIDLATEVGP